MLNRSVWMLAVCTIATILAAWGSTQVDFLPKGHMDVAAGGIMLSLALVVFSWIRSTERYLDMFLWGALLIVPLTVLMLADADGLMGNLRPTISTLGIISAAEVIRRHGDPKVGFWYAFFVLLPGLVAANILVLQVVGETSFGDIVMPIFATMMVGGIGVGLGRLFPPKPQQSAGAGQ